MRYNDIRRCAMSEEQWAVVDRVSGQIQAEILRGMLEAQGIQVVLSHESAGSVFQMGVGTLGAVEVMVPAEMAELAEQLLEEYYGKFSKAEGTAPSDETEAPDEADMDS